MSLDDLRRETAARVRSAGGPDRPPQAWTVRALEEAARRQAALLADGRGYLADATHLRRRERVAHVAAAHAAGLPAVALLLPVLPLAVLAARDRARPPQEQVPPEVLARHVHRRALLDAASLSAEGFDVVADATTWLPA